MRGRERDLQRRRVYRAESLFLRSMPEVAGVLVHRSHQKAEFVRLLRSPVGQWAMRLNGVEGVPENLDVRTVSSGGSRATAGRPWNQSRWNVRMGSGQHGDQMYTIIHEAAHLVGHVKSMHGPAFCRLLLALVMQEFGPSACVELQMAFHVTKVEY